MDIIRKKQGFLPCFSYFCYTKNIEFNRFDKLKLHVLYKLYFADIPLTQKMYSSLERANNNRLAISASAGTQANIT